MGKETEISWCDHTFNIVWGCHKVSEACRSCYAEAWSKRVGLKIWGQDAPRRTFGEKHWREPIAWNARALRDNVRRRVFCSSMADVFEDHPTVAEERPKLWPLIEATPQLDWMLLTKRPENMVRFAPPHWAGGWPLNVWAGTTAENQERLDERLEHIVRVPVGVRYLSMEPLLGPTKIGLLGTCPKDWGHGYRPVADLIHLVIVGGESGSRPRPMHPAWVRSLRDECVESKVAFHLKQWGEWAPYGDESKHTHGGGETAARMQTWMRDDGETGGVWIIDDDGSWSNWTGEPGADMSRIAILNQWGKKRAGRELDGRIWNEFPRPVSA